MQFAKCLITSLMFAPMWAGIEQPSLLEIKQNPIAIKVDSLAPQSTSVSNEATFEAEILSYFFLAVLLSVIFLLSYKNKIFFIKSSSNRLLILKKDSLSWLTRFYNKRKGNYYCHFYHILDIQP